MVENYKNESLVDVAYSVLKGTKEPIAFSKLFDEVCARAEIDSYKAGEVISSFFTNLSLDGRFVALKNNEWGLRVNYKFDEIKHDLNAFYEDIDVGPSKDDEEDEDDEEKILKGEYDDDDDDESEREVTHTESEEDY